MGATDAGGERGGRNLRKMACDASAGASAGAIAATFVCPLDVIKTRLQVYGLSAMQTSGRRGSFILVSLQHIIRNEGLKGLYCGLTPTLAALLPTWAVYFPVYGQLKGVLHTYDGSHSQLTIASNVIAATGAGAATAIATNPLWVVKTRLQTQGMREGVVPYKNIFSALRRIIHEEGFRGWYSGLLPSLAGISHVAIQFPAYERMKLYLAEQDNKNINELKPWELAIASSFSKIVASVSTYPHEVVRSRLQEQGQLRNSDLHYAGVIDCIKKVFNKEGIPGFYRGCATNLLRTTPNAMITFTSYEMINRYLLRHFSSSPKEKTAGPPSKPDNRDIKPLVGTTTTTTNSEGSKALPQTVNSSNDRTHFVPALSNADKL